MERVHFGPPWQVAQLKPGTTAPTVPNSVRPSVTATLSVVVGAGADLMLATQVAIASWRGSRPALRTGRKLVTGGGVDRPRLRRALARLPRVTQVPLGVPAGPATAPLLAIVYSSTVVCTAPVLSMPPAT